MSKKVKVHNAGVALTLPMKKEGKYVDHIILSSGVNVVCEAKMEMIMKDESCEKFFKSEQVTIMEEKKKEAKKETKKDAKKEKPKTEKKAAAKASK